MIERAANYERATTDCQIWNILESRDFHFHMTFLVVEILNQRQLIKYA